MKTILIDAINTFIIKGTGVFTEMHRLLERHPNKKIIVTNANDEEIHNNELDVLPYELYTLKHIPEKTNPEYYKQLLQEYNLSAEEVICVEHDQEAVKSARSVGITTHHYDDKTKNLTALKEFLDKNL